MEAVRTSVSEVVDALERLREDIRQELQD